MKKRILLLAIIVVAFLFVTGCADVEPIKPCLEGKIYGFWNGLWHGLTIPFSFLGSLFSDKISIYAVNNNGGWYDFGYFIGLGGWFGSARSTKK